MKNISNYLRIFISCQFIFLQVSLSLSKGQTRIVNGTSTTIEKAPYLVQIRLNDALACGGALLSNEHVVTAAHCVFGKDPKEFTVVGGSSRLSHHGCRSKVDKIYIPKSYNTPKYHKDVAVLKLAKRLTGTRIKPATLCKTTFKTGDPVKLFGWGRIWADMNYHPDKLQTASVNIFDKSICEEKYKELGLEITSTMFCAFAVDKDSCTGDSGGPAMVNDDFCGVVSWGMGCGDGEFPGVYTDLKEVMSFVTDAMKLK